jgi:uncharacterized protein
MSIDARDDEQCAGERSASCAHDCTDYCPPVETHVISSRYVDQTYRIQVMQPVRKKGDMTRLPVVYVTDGNLMFEAFRSIALSMQRAAPDAPQFMLVGIGYPSNLPIAGSLLRARDLTFPGYPQIRIRPPNVEGVLVAKEGTKNFYGADDFLQFLANELFPTIDVTYPTSAGERTYFGHSAGGGFGLYTLFTRSELFNNYIVSSPGLIYHGESSAGIRYDEYDFVLQYARNFIQSGEALPGTRLFMSVGMEEEYEPQLLQWRLTSSFYRMAALLRAASIPGLAFIAETFAGERHETVWPRAFIRGVHALLGATSGAQGNERAQEFVAS